MKLRHAMISLTLILAAGCDTMEQDVDGKTLSINDDPAYFLADSEGIIDLPSRIVSPGKIRVEITGSTSNGVLEDIGKGLLRYSPSKGSKNDFFRFRVFNGDNNVLGEDTIQIIVGDSTNVPCAIYTRNDEVRNVTGTIVVDVLENDWACDAPLTITGLGQEPMYGTATVVGNKIQYTPGSSFTGHDVLLYKASAASFQEQYGLLRIFGRDTIPSDSTGFCRAVAVNDIFFKPLNDTSLMFLDVLANDTICNDTSIFITRNPTFGNAYVDGERRKIGYRNLPASNSDDTLFYQLNATSGVARVIIKRN